MNSIQFVGRIALSLQSNKLDKGEFGSKTNWLFNKCLKPRHRFGNSSENKFSRIFQPLLLLDNFSIMYYAWISKEENKKLNLAALTDTWTFHWKTWREIKFHYYACEIY